MTNAGVRKLMEIQDIYQTKFEKFLQTELEKYKGYVHSAYLQHTCQPGNRALKKRWLEKQAVYDYFRAQVKFRRQINGKKYVKAD